MNEYAEGHVKRDPVTGVVAIRTQFPDNVDFVGMTWLCASSVRGPYNTGTATVEAWDDLFVPPSV